MSKKIFFWGIVVVIGIALFQYTPLKNYLSGSGQGMSGNLPKERGFALTIAERKVVEGDSVLVVEEGDRVTITVHSDEDEELHIHGYDRTLDLEKNVPASITFTADIAGRFTFELEGSKTELGALEVYPRP